jgi:hypothetical protein
VTWWITLEDPKRDSLHILFSSDIPHEKTWTGLDILDSCSGTSTWKAFVDGRETEKNISVFAREFCFRNAEWYTEFERRCRKRTSNGA